MTGLGTRQKPLTDAQRRLAAAHVGAMLAAYRRALRVYRSLPVDQVYDAAVLGYLTAVRRLSRGDVRWAPATVIYRSVFSRVRHQSKFRYNAVPGPRHESYDPGVHTYFKHAF